MKENVAVVVSVACKKHHQAFSCVFAQYLSLAQDQILPGDKCHWVAGVNGRLIGATHAFQQQEAASHAACKLVLTFPSALRTLKTSCRNIKMKLLSFKGKKVTFQQHDTLECLARTEWILVSCLFCVRQLTDVL